MATAVACSASLAAPSALSARRSEISGAGSSALKVSGLPSLTVSRRFDVLASGSKKKVNTKTPFGPSGGTKFKDGVDASGRKMKGKGVYQYSKKYGANVDGYSPIYVEEEWSPTGSQYAGGQTGLALWALTLGALLVGGILLVYNTSALA